MSNVPSTLSRPLKVIIVGAGIAGLSAACALRGERHEIIILERSQLLPHREVGAAITMGAQGRRILADWGFNHSRARGMASTGWSIYNASSGDLQSRNRVSDAEKIFGFPNSTYHRIDLHSELKLLATSPEIGNGTPATLRTGVSIVDVDTGNASVTLSSGEIVGGDILIGADGSHSFVRAKVLGRPAEPRSGGITLFRVLLPREIVESDPLLWKWFEDASHKIWADKDRFLIAYWCRDMQILNIAATVPAGFSEAVPSGWDSVGDPTELKQLFGECAEPIPQILSHVTKCGTWIASDLEPLEKWTEGRAILIGDAAHPMFPHQASGSAMAIEDAEAMGAAFSNLHGAPEDLSYISRVLKQVEAVRWERATLVQGRSRAAANFYFKLPEVDDRLKGMIESDPTKAMVELYSYKGARDYAKKHGIEYPDVVHVDAHL